MDRRHKFIVSDKHQFIYYEIQKCATESVRKYFLGKNNQYGAVRISGGRSKGLLYEEKGYAQFTFIRNPWERIVSAWVSKFVFYHDPKHPTLPGIRDPELSLTTSFDEFVRFVAKTPDKWADCHFKSMHQFIPDRGIIIGHVEDFERDFKYIRTFIGLMEREIPHENTTSDKRKKPWREYYTKELQSLITERYKEDIELYSYAFN